MCLILFDRIKTLWSRYHYHLDLIGKKIKAQTGSGVTLSGSHSYTWLQSLCWDEILEGHAGCYRGGKVTVKSEKAAWRKTHLTDDLARGRGEERPHGQRAVDMQRSGSREWLGD